VSRVTVVIMIAAILATSSLFFNIGVAEATHGGIHIVGGTLNNPPGTFACPPPPFPTSGVGPISIFVNQQDNGQFEGFVEAFVIINGGNRITSAETDGDTFTIRGSLAGSCNTPAPLYTLTYSVLGECGTGVTVRASVSNGASGTYQANVRCEVAAANSPPTAALTANPSTINEGETSALDASGSSDPDSGDSLTYSFSILDNGPGTITDQTDASDPTATYQAPLDVSNDQTVTIQVEVDDGNDGGTDTATAEILVRDVPDTTPPVVTVPDDITEEATSANGAQVNYEVSANDDTDGSATLNADGTTTQDDVGGDITISCTPASGSTFPLGETTVECTATDTAGNTGTGSFTVTIQDTTPPVISVPDDITEEATGPDGAVVSFDVSAEDLVDGPVDVSCDHSSGDTFPLGQTTVTCSAQDSRGNSAQDSFIIEVVDTTAPDVEITGAEDRTGREISDGGTTPIPYIRITFEATDAVGIDSRGTECSLDGGAFTSCTSPKVYDRLSRGSHEVTVRATDAAGNTGEDEFTWTVSNPAEPRGGQPATAAREPPSAATEEEAQGGGEGEQQSAATEEDTAATTTDEEGGAAEGEGEDEGAA
jgi:hypothetical protein